MPEYPRRGWLVVVIGTTAALRCARALRRQLPARRIALIALRSGADGTLAVLAKPFRRPAWRVAAAGLCEELLDRLADTAVSVRDQGAVAREFGTSLGSVALDVVVLLDATDPRSAVLCRTLLGRLSAERVLRRSPAPGLRLQVLLPGQRRHELAGGIAEVLREQGGAGEPFTDHTICFHPSNLDRFALGPQELADLAGSALGAILQLGVGHPLRALLAPLAAGLPQRLRYWSLGFASVTGRGEEFVRHVRHHYARRIKRLWLRGAVKRPRARTLAEAVLRRLLDSDVPAGELGTRLARWAARFFREECLAGDRPRATPTDLVACLDNMVAELAARSQRLAANLPNFPVPWPKPKDPRGWVRRLLNWLSGNRIFRWQCPWPPSAEARDRAQAERGRLLGLEPAIMGCQLAAQRALAALRATPDRPPLAPPRTHPWPDAWMGRIVERLHPRVVSRVGAAGLPEALARGRNPLAVFQEDLAQQLNIPPGTRGAELIAAIESLAGRSGDWLRQALRELTAQAAPWWSGPLGGDMEEHAFACLPREQLFAAAEAADPGLQPTAWDVEAYGVFRLLQGCVPDEIEPDVTARGVQPSRPPRGWIPAAQVG